MRRPVAITSFATWTGAGARVRAAPLPSASGPLGAWPEAPALSRIHPRARRPHPSATALVQLAHETLAGRGAPASLSIVLGTRAGCAAADRRFDQSLRERGMPFGSPSTFVYTLSTAAAGEVSIALGLSGPVLTLSSGQTSALAAVALGADQVASGRCEGCLCGGMEVTFDGQTPTFEQAGSDHLALFLLQPAAGEGVLLKGWAEGFADASPVGRGGALDLAAALAAGRAGPVEAFDPEGFWVRLSLEPLAAGDSPFGDVKCLKVDR